MLEKIKGWFSSNKDPAFIAQRFAHNNICVFLIGSFLIFEQLFYALILNSPFSNQGKIHFITAILSASYVFMSIKLRKIPDSGAKLWHHYFTVSFGFFGFAIVIFRSLFIESGTLFALPIIYIAVLYGFAFIFFVAPLASGIIYGSSFFIMVILLPIYNDKVQGVAFIADLLSNSSIAWIASVIGYRRFENEYKIRKILARKNNELMKLSTTDSLTQLFNRRKVDKVLEELHGLAEKLNIQYSIILMDIDFFKNINDNFGHQVGDSILVELAEILRENVRKEDVLGRWGGEEFILLCQNTNEKEAVIIAQKIKNSIANHIFENDIKITCSFGIAGYRKASKFTSIVSLADIALYESKSKGRNLIKLAVQKNCEK